MGERHARQVAYVLAYVFAYGTVLATQGCSGDCNVNVETPDGSQHTRTFTGLSHKCCSNLLNMQREASRPSFCTESCFASMGPTDVADHVKKQCDANRGFARLYEGKGRYWLISEKEMKEQQAALDKGPSKSRSRRAADKQKEGSRAKHGREAPAGAGFSNLQLGEAELGEALEHEPGAPRVEVTRGIPKMSTEISTWASPSARRIDEVDVDEVTEMGQSVDVDTPVSLVEARRDGYREGLRGYGLRDDAESAPRGVSISMQIFSSAHQIFSATPVETVAT